jgi:FcoT-like thioesterase domain
MCPLDHLDLGISQNAPHPNAATTSLGTALEGTVGGARDETVIQLPIVIEPDFVADILRPYKSNARYLKAATITQMHAKAAENAKALALVTASGRFAIPESCYIDDTGHFNAVEFNICFNQLAYVMFGKCVEAGIFHKLRCERVKVPSLAEYKRDQLPAMVIVSIESRYYKQLNSRDFTATLTLDKSASLGAAWFFSCSVSFADADGVKAKGAVLLAYSPNFAPVRH